MVELQKKLLQVFVSIFIIGVLSVQFLVSVAKEDWYWPFIDYPMYSGHLYNDGDRIVARLNVYAVHSDGSEVMLQPEDIGTTEFWVYNSSFAAPLLSHEGEEGRSELASRIVAFVEHYELKSGRQVVELRVEDSAALVTKEGMKPAEPEVLRILSLSPVVSQKPNN